MRIFSRRSAIACLSAACLSLAAAVPALADGTGGRVALRGYDPVSYFTAGHPEQGKAEFSYSYRDATYLFVSDEHLKMFAADAAHYAPQYDGYCTISMSMGHKLEGDPQAFTITDGKLYIFSSTKGVPTFSADADAISKKANASWVGLKTN